MKKRYLTPTLRIYHVKRTNIVCTSDADVPIGGPGEPKAAARDNAIWD